MNSRSADWWLQLSKVLRIVGFAGYGTVFLSGLILTGYYSGHRPRFPQPEKGWTTHLRWSFNQPTYGAQRDDRNQLLLFDLSFPFLFIGLLGEGIRKVNERNEPWKAK